MHLKRLVIHGLLITGLLTGLGLTAIAHDDDDPPSDEQKAFAARTSELLKATLVAALLQEFAETELDNVEEGTKSISLVFNNRNKNIRLVGTNGPLQENNRPRDAFERTALAIALTAVEEVAGDEYVDVQRVDDQWYYRRSIPLSNFSNKCAYCHSNFPSGPTPDRMGALMLRVPIQ